MSNETLYFVMDDTNNDYDFDELREFEKTLDPDVLAEMEAKTRAIDRAFDNRRKKSAA